MAKIYGQLEEAQFQNKSSDDAAAIAGKVWWNTTDGQAKLDDGTNVRAFLRNDGAAVIGNNGTANNNIRLHRGANEVLQFVLGGDSTAEGTLSTNVAQFSARAENYANTGALPSAGNAGRIAYVTGSNSLYADNGSSWDQIASTDNSLAVTSKTANYTILSTDDVILCDGSGGAFTVTLPAAASNTGKRFYIVKTDADIGEPITVDGNASETINGALTTTLNTQNECLVVISDGTNFLILERRIPKGWASWTPTLTGFGTVSGLNARWRRDGEDLIAEVVFTAGSVTGDLAEATLPSDITIDDLDTVNYPTGSWVRSIAGTTTESNAGSVLVSQSNSLTSVYFGQAENSGTTAASPTAPANGNDIATGSTQFSFYFRVRVDGWNG